MISSVRDMKLQAEDITCGGCAEDMEKILRETEGILDASVNFQEGSISVTYDEDIIGREQVFSKVRNLGFNVRITGNAEL